MSKYLISATTSKEGDNYDLLPKRMAACLDNGASRCHVAAIVGGFDLRQKHIGQEGVLFKPVPQARQMEAVKFLTDTRSTGRKWMIDPQILRRIEAVGELSRIRSAQSSECMDYPERGFTIAASFKRSSSRRAIVAQLLD